MFTERLSSFELFFLQGKLSFSKRIQPQRVKSPPLLTVQASTSASSEQSFQKHHWNMTGCWGSCGCEASAPMPKKRPGCSLHSQETPWFMNKHMHVQESRVFTRSTRCSHSFTGTPVFVFTAQDVFHPCFVVWKRNQTSWCPADGHRCWRCVGWLLPSPVSQPRGSSPPSCPGWWPCWECGAAAKRSVIAEGCWMFSATCCCCCGRGTCIQMSHCRCCSPCIPTPASDITPSSPCVQVKRALYDRRGLPLSEKAGVWDVFSYLYHQTLYSSYDICLPARGGVIMRWDDDNTDARGCPQEVNHLFMSQCCYCHFADLDKSASLSQPRLPGVPVGLNLWSRSGFNDNRCLRALFSVATLHHH